MAIPVPTSVTELVDAGLTWAMAHDANRRYRKFMVTFKDPSFFNPDGAVQANGIPKLGDAFPQTSHYCQALIPQVEGVSGKNWIVTAEYAFSGLWTPGNNEPWVQQPLVDYDVVRYRKAMEYDYSTASDPAAGPQHVVNFIGEPFDPPLDSEVRNRHITYSFFATQSTFNPHLSSQCTDTVNSGDVVIDGELVPAGKALCHCATARKRIWAANGTIYYEIKHEIEVEQSMPILFQNWICKSFHYYKVASTPPKVLFMVPSDQSAGTFVPSPDPRVIMKDGTPWPTASQIAVPQIPPDYLRLKMHPTADWAPLLLK